MARENDIEKTVRALIAKRTGTTGGRRPLDDGLALTSGGAGLDSIALVELLLDVERELGVGGSVELLEGPPITVGRLVAWALDRASA